MPGSILNALPTLICHSVRWSCRKTLIDPQGIGRIQAPTTSVTIIVSLLGGLECNLNSGSLSVNCQPDCLGRGVVGLHWEVEAQFEANLDMQEGLCPASLWGFRACLLSRVGAFVREHPG